MKEREPLVVGGLVALLLLLWLGYLFHTSPRFAGSAWGGALGVSAAVLMLIPLAYPVVKRVPAVKRWVTRRVSMRALLDWHMYTGILGAILGLLHTGHKFDSPLGIALTTMMLLVVVSGFVGRHLMKLISLEIREKKELLTQLELGYRQTAGELAAHPDLVAVLRPWSGFWGRLTASLFRVLPHATTVPTATRALDLADSIADVEYAIKSHDTLKRWFAGWLWVHIVTSVFLYVLLALHVWAGIHYGLRWWA